MNFLRCFSSLVCTALLATACAKKEPASPSPAGPGPSAQRHEHKAPHAGTAVVLGEETYHLELVLDAAAGKLSAYVLDGEMENFIRVAAPSFEVVASVEGAKRSLVFNAVADPASGETVGDTALFEAKADWLKNTPRFDARLTRLEIRRATFTDIAFNFPAGNDRD